jgi:hypothetical protein
MSDVEKQFENKPLKVRIHSLPKVIFFYPVWLFSIVCAIVMSIDPATSWAGPAWMAIFTLNLFVIAYDFTEERTIIVLFATIAAVLGLVLLGALSDIFSFLTGLKPAMNATFYILMSVIFGLVFIIAWVGSRLDYWELEPNEIIHRYGLFRRMKRFSTESLRWDKLIPDVMERIMLGTGTIILTTPFEKHPIVIDHVLRIGKVDEQIAHVLGVKQVVAERHHSKHGHEDETGIH